MGFVDKGQRQQEATFEAQALTRLPLPVNVTSQMLASSENTPKKMQPEDVRSDLPESAEQRPMPASPTPVELFLKVWVSFVPYKNRQRFPDDPQGSQESPQLQIHMHGPLLLCPNSLPPRASVYVRCTCLY